MNNVVIISGGASGIGQAAGRLFASRGWTVAVLDVKNNPEFASGHANNHDGGIMFFQTDVSDFVQIKAAVSECISKCGRVDTLVNCAGILMREESPTDIARVIDVNLKGAIFLSKLVIPHLLKSGGGSIINIGSITGLLGSPGYPVYSATKSAMIGLTRSLAKIYARNKIRVNCVCPGSISGTSLLKTHLNQVPSKEDFIRLMQKIPLGRIGKPDDVAQAVYFLSSPDASHITGEIINIDGGERFNG